MRDIIVYTNIHENSRVNIGVFFSDAGDCGLVSINMKVICDRGEICNLLSNKMVYLSNNSSLWADSIQYDFSSIPIKGIVEIHGSGKLLYIKSFSYKENDIDCILYILNADVCWRRENLNVISVFNTNGNLLFLKGIYKDLWEILITPVKYEEIINVLTKKGYSEPKIKASVNALMKRGLIFEERKTNIAYI